MPSIRTGLGWGTRYVGMHHTPPRRPGFLKILPTPSLRHNYPVYPAHSADPLKRKHEVAIEQRLSKENTGSLLVKSPTSPSPESLYALSFARRPISVVKAATSRPLEHSGIA